MPKKDMCLKNLERICKRDNSTQYVFLDSQISRNIQHERNVSYEFHNMMKRRRMLNHTFESGFIKRLANKREVQVSASMMADVDSSEFSSGDSLSYINTVDTTVLNDSSIISVSVDSFSNKFNAKNTLEFLRNGNSLKERLVSRSCDDLLVIFNNTENKLDKSYVMKNLKAHSGFSLENLRNIFDEKKDFRNESVSPVFTLSMKIKDNFSKDDFIKRYKRKRKKCSKDIRSIEAPIENKIPDPPENSKKGKQSFFGRITKFFERIIGWKCSSAKNNDTQPGQTDKRSVYLADKASCSRQEGGEPSTATNQVALCQRDVLKITTPPAKSKASTATKRSKKNKNLLPPLRRLYTTSLSYPIRQFFRSNSRSANSTGILLQATRQAQYRPSVPHYLEIPDKKRLIDISRGYYPLAKWTLINRLFRQKSLSEKSANKTKTEQGTIPVPTVLVG